MPTDFQLDPRLQADTHKIATWPLCEVLMMNDRQYPWLILVPRVADATELYQLSTEQRSQLDDESIFLGRTLMRLFSGDKLNVAALGNVVSQLHIHHIVRFRSDPAWPAPVWGQRPAQAFEASALADRIALMAPLVSPDW